MNPVAHLRRLRSLPRIAFALLLLVVGQTALVPCAMAQTQLNDHAQMMAHCAYCPTADTIQTGSDCAYPHDPSVDGANVAAHAIAALLASPLLLPDTFDIRATRGAFVAIPLEILAPVSSRPLKLTYCVQLK